MVFALLPIVFLVALLGLVSAFTLHEIPIEPELAYEILYEPETFSFLPDLDFGTPLSQEVEGSFKDLMVMYRRDNIQDLLHTWNNWMSSIPAEQNTAIFFHLERLHDFLCQCYLSIHSTQIDDPQNFVSNMKSWRSSGEHYQLEHEIVPVQGFAFWVWYAFIILEPTDPAGIFLGVVFEILNSVISIED